MQNASAKNVNKAIGGLMERISERQAARPFQSITSFAHFLRQYSEEIITDSQHQEALENLVGKIDLPILTTPRDPSDFD